MNFCSQKSAVMSVIRVLVSLMLVAVLTAGGNASMDLFYCKAAGCAADVTRVYCSDDEPIFEKRPIANCSGPPPLWSVCQYGGHAFVSAHKGNHCDFEGANGYIPTNKCADHDPICSLPGATTPSPSSPPTTPPATTTMGPSVGTIIGYTFLVLCLAAVPVGGLIYLWCRNRRRQERDQTQDPTRDPEENKPLEIQPSGDNNESNQPNGGLDRDDVPQRGHGD